MKHFKRPTWQEPFTKKGCKNKLYKIRYLGLELITEYISFLWLSRQTQCTDHTRMILIIIWTKMDLFHVSQSFKQIAFWQRIRSLWQVQKNGKSHLGRSWIQNSLGFETKKETCTCSWHGRVGRTVKAVFDIQAELNWNHWVIFSLFLEHNFELNTDITYI